MSQTHKEATTLLEDVSAHDQTGFWLAVERAKLLRAAQAAIDEGLASGVSTSNADQIRQEILSRYAPLAVSPADLELVCGVEVDLEASLEDGDHGRE